MSSFAAFFLSLGLRDSMSQFASVIYGFRQMSMSAKPPYHDQMKYQDF